MMSDLPLDLVEEILSRVPATSLKRLRSTCKRWNALFKDQRFTQKHFRKAPKESMVLMLKEYRVCSMSVNLNVAPPTIEFQGELGLKDSLSNSEQVEITEVFHCDGLLLCSTNDNRLVVVWNPCLGETRWIQHKNSGAHHSRFALGYIQNNKSCRSYKIMRRWGYDDDQRFEIYEFSSDSWRVLDNVALAFTILSNIGLSLEGNSYWLPYDKKDKYYCLLCFDFTAERFKRMCLPPLVFGQMALSVVGGKQLAVLIRRNSTSMMEIWITNKIDQAVLKWSKYFTVKPICRDYFFSFLIDEEKKVALCCTRSFEIDKNKIYITGEDDEYYTEILYAKSSKNCGGIHLFSVMFQVWFKFVRELLHVFFGYFLQPGSAPFFS